MPVTTVAYNTSSVKKSTPCTRAPPDPLPFDYNTTISRPPRLPAEWHTCTDMCSKRYTCTSTLRWADVQHYGIYRAILHTALPPAPAPAPASSFSWESPALSISFRSGGGVVSCFVVLRVRLGLTQICWNTNTFVSVLLFVQAYLPH